jgi:hypothetical protein
VRHQYPDDENVSLQILRRAKESDLRAPQIVHAKGGGSKKLSIRMRNPCNRQLISIHVRLQFFDSSLRGFFAKNRAPLFEQPLRQLRDVFGMLNQVTNLNSAHTNSLFV